MKLSILIVLFSLTAQARQYIQCSPIDVYSFEGLVLNINSEQSTLFKTNGVHLPDQDTAISLVNINLIIGRANFATYKSEEDELIEIPMNIIGEYSNSFNINLIRKSLKREYSCFSSIYND